MHESIAVVFDFDDTLSPNTTSGFIAQAGLNPTMFWSETVNPLYDQGWDPVPAYLYKLIELDRQGRADVSQAALANWGRQAPLHKGVDTLFARLRQVVAQTNPNVAIEFRPLSRSLALQRLTVL